MTLSSRMALTGGGGPATAAILLWLLMLGELLLLTRRLERPKRDRMGVAGVGVTERERGVGLLEAEAAEVVLFKAEGPWPQLGTNRKLR